MEHYSLAVDCYWIKRWQVFLKFLKRLICIKLLLPYLSYDNDDLTNEGAAMLLRLKWGARNE
jgi:hypothetical protein